MESRSNSQASSTDYELMQHEQVRENKLMRGYSVRDAAPNEQSHYDSPRQPHHSRHTRWGRLSSSRRKYAGLQATRHVEADYAVPGIRQHSHGRDTNAGLNRYDGFFEGSTTDRNIEEEEEEDSRHRSLVTEREKKRGCCSNCCHVTKYIFCFSIITLALLISLGGVGLALYNMFAGDSSSTMCDTSRCRVTLTMAADAENNCTDYNTTMMTCTTETLITNMTVSIYIIYLPTPYI